MAQQTRRLQVSVHTPWGPVVIGVAFLVTPGTDGVLVRGAKPLRDSLTVNVIGSL